MTSSPEETEVLGERIAAFLGKGSVLALKGPLGAGKTCLVKGIARFLGVGEEITSPTYTIISEYEARHNAGGKIPFYHIDAYRLDGSEDFEAMGGGDYLGGEGIAVVEWSERIAPSLPAGTVQITIELLDNNQRRIGAAA